MKKLSFYLVAICFLLVFKTNEAQAQVKNNVVKANLFGFIVGQYQLAYERAINENWSVQLGAGVISREWDLSVGTSSTTQKDNGIIIIPEARYYFSESPKGAYAGVFLRYRSVTNKVDYPSIDQNFNSVTRTLEATRTAIGGGVLIGYQVLLSDAVALDVQIGPQYKSVNLEIENNDPNSTVNLEGEDDGIGVRFAFNFGIAF